MHLIWLLKLLMGVIYYIYNVIILIKSSASKKSYFSILVSRQTLERNHWWIAKAEMKDFAQYREWLDCQTSAETLLSVNMFSDDEGRKSYALLLLLKSRVSCLSPGTHLEMGMLLSQDQWVGVNNVGII